MKKSELIKILSSAEEDEVYIEINNTLYGIGIDRTEEMFDGFDTVYPASITLRPIDEE